MERFLQVLLDHGWTRDERELVPPQNINWSALTDVEEQALTHLVTWCGYYYMVAV